MPIPTALVSLAKYRCLLKFSATPESRKKNSILSVQNTWSVCEESEQQISQLFSKSENHPGVYLALFHFVGGC